MSYDYLHPSKFCVSIVIDALTHSGLQDDMLKGMNSLETNDTWLVVEAPLVAKLAFINKVNPDGLRLTSIRQVISMAASHR